MTNNNKTNLFIADDHQIVIDAIKLQLSIVEDQFKIIGTALNGTETLSKIKKLSVDILILDIGMPKMNGLEVLKVIQKDHPNIKVLVLTMFDDLKHVREMIKNGAKGYILKNKSAQYVIDALVNIKNGEDYFPNDVAQIALRGLIPKDDKNEHSNKEIILKSITERETELLEVLLLDLSAKEIAEILHISHRTVETRKKNLMKKTGAKSTVGLVRFAMENGYKKPS